MSVASPVCVIPSILDEANWPRNSSEGVGKSIPFPFPLVEDATHVAGSSSMSGVSPSPFKSAKTATAVTFLSFSGQSHSQSTSIVNTSVIELYEASTAVGIGVSSVNM